MLRFVLEGGVCVPPSSGLDGGTNTVSFSICLSISLFFVLLPCNNHCPLIDRLFSGCDGAVLWDVGWGRMLWETSLMNEGFGILTHMHNLTWYTLCVCIIVAMSNVCMYACLYEHNNPLVLL